VLDDGATLGGLARLLLLCPVGASIRGMPGGEREARAKAQRAGGAGGGKAPKKRRNRSRASVVHKTVFRSVCVLHVKDINTRYAVLSGKKVFLNQQLARIAGV
jgi:hypothetical protein